MGQALSDRIEELNAAPRYEFCDELDRLLDTSNVDLCKLRERDPVAALILESGWDDTADTTEASREAMRLRGA